MISIHALLAESDLDNVSAQDRPKEFLSTLSLRRATVKFSVSGSVISISIHALLAESDHIILCQLSAPYISIHALLAESDPLKSESLTTYLDFYPRSPCGERRGSPPPCARPTRDFYPRSPCGERPTDMSKRLIEFRFLSTLSLRRATVSALPGQQY